MRANPATAELPVVVISTESSEHRIALLRAQGVEFIHKPFRPEGLRATILRITGSHHDFGADDLALAGGGLGI